MARDSVNSGDIARSSSRAIGQETTSKGSGSSPRQALRVEIPGQQHMNRVAHVRGREAQAAQIADVPRAETRFFLQLAVGCLRIGLAVVHAPLRQR